MKLKKATRQQAKLRIGLSGPSGSGKTHSALLLAYGLCGDWSKIAVIDTENGSADLYSHLGEYNTLTIEPDFSPERYIEAIEVCENAGMEVIVIDSITHEWSGKGGCLEINDKIAHARFKGNTWSAWSVTTPRHQSFIDKIVNSKAHIITTARSKTDTIQIDGRVKKVGMKDEQREGFEYEMTLMFNLDREGHLAIASKDRTNLLIDRDPFVISSKTGEEIKNWNMSGEKVIPLEDKQAKNFSKYFDIFTTLESKLEFGVQKIALKEELAKDGSFISKNQLDELSETIKNISFEDPVEEKSVEEKKEKVTTKK